MTADSLAGLRILVAEDGLMIALLIERFLCDFGCVIVGPVSTVARATEALEMHEIDGALLDINLREESVFPVAEKMRIRALPFILVTSYSVRDVEPELIRMAPRIRKPFTRETLMERMIEVFRPAVA